jgi:hypothetical protein
MMTQELFPVSWCYLCSDITVDQLLTLVNNLPADDRCDCCVMGMVLVIGCGEVAVLLMEQVFVIPE